MKINWFKGELHGFEFPRLFVRITLLPRQYKTPRPWFHKHCSYVQFTFVLKLIQEFDINHWHLGPKMETVVIILNCFTAGSVSPTGKGGASPTSCEGIYQHIQFSFLSKWSTAFPLARWRSSVGVGILVTHIELDSIAASLFVLNKLSWQIVYQYQMTRSN